MKRQKLLLTEKQVDVLQSQAIINTLYSMDVDNTDGEFDDYDKEAIRQLIKKIGDLI